MINAVGQPPPDIEPLGSEAAIASPCLVQGDLNASLDMVTPSIEYTDYDIPLAQQISVALSLNSIIRYISRPI